jgi:hypothetical protein
MHPLAPAGEVVLTPDVALMFVTLERLAKIIFLVRHHMTSIVLMRCKTKQYNQTKYGK